MFKPLPIRQSNAARGDLVFNWIALGCALVIPLIMGGILIELIRHSTLSLDKFGLGFLTTDAWNPVTENFGALSSIYGTAISTLIAMLIAMPLGLLIALFLAELAHPKVSTFFGTAIELLAAIPSIIYGMWGLFVFAPFMSQYIQPLLSKSLGWLPLFQGPPLGIGVLSAGIILAFMILPYISSVARDVFRMVPTVVKEAAYGVGATGWEVTRGVVVPYSIRGVVGAGFLALGRALGETMAVTFVIGNNHRISASLFSGGNTIASTLANEFTEASEPVYLSALIELGLVLFLITMLFQTAAQLWLWQITKKLA
jgi:phosphate transport system permease protein